LNQEAREIINTLKMWLVANHMPIIPEDRLDEILPKLDIIELNHVMDTKDAANIAFVKDVMTSDLFLDQMFTIACRWAKRFYDQGRRFPLQTAERWSPSTPARRTPSSRVRAW
jgi:hypothetical protein